LEERGTSIDELERLALLYGLTAQIQETTIGDLRRHLAAGRFPIAYIDRAVFDLAPRRRATHSIREAMIHVVIPTRVTASAISFHDPLPPSVTRKSIRLFQQAHSILGSCCVICSKRMNR
jgi:hypothetical protein